MEFPRDKKFLNLPFLVLKARHPVIQENIIIMSNYKLNMIVLPHARARGVKQSVLSAVYLLSVIVVD